MKKLLFNTLLGLAFVSSTKVYSQDILWEKSFGGKHADYLMDAVATADYGFILAGSSLSNKSGNKTEENKGDLDYWIWKMKENGDLDWQRSFGGSGMDLLQSIKNTKDGGFILAGTSSSPGPSSSSSRQTEGVSSEENYYDKKEACRGGDDFWIIKLNAGGGEEWQKTIGGMGQEKLQSICQTKDGGYLLGGSSSSYPATGTSEQEEGEMGDKTAANFGNMDYWLVKLDHKGKIVWQKTFGGIYMDELRSIEQTKEGGFILGGYSNSPISGNKSDDNIGTGDFWVLKLDAVGEIEWQKTLGGDQDDQLYVVHQTFDGNYIVGGNSNSEPSNSKRASNASGTDIWVLKLGQDGAVLWQETYNIGKVDVLASLIENADHSLLLGGFSLQTPENRMAKGKKSNPKKEEKGINDYVAIKITEKGEELWRKSVGSDGEDLLKKGIETRDGGYLLAGTSTPQTAIQNIGNSESGGLGGKSLSGMQQMQNPALEKATNDINKSITDAQEDINNSLKEKMTGATNTINEALDSKQDSNFKYGLNAPTGGVSLPNLNPSDLSQGGNQGDALDGLANAMSNKQAKRGTGDQAKTFGSTDFWVVKLKDKNKPDKVKQRIEALPNPALNFTNIIIGYDFESGTATVADLAGHVLQQFAISSRTVPIDLSRYPEGIYVVNIATNVQTDGVKVIKGINKN